MPSCGIAGCTTRACLGCRWGSLSAASTTASSRTRSARNSPTHYSSINTIRKQHGNFLIENCSCEMQGLYRLVMQSLPSLGTKKSKWPSTRIHSRNKRCKSRSSNRWESTSGCLLLPIGGTRRSFSPVAKHPIVHRTKHLSSTYRLVNGGKICQIWMSHAKSTVAARLATKFMSCSANAKPMIGDWALSTWRWLSQQKLKLGLPLNFHSLLRYSSSLFAQDTPGTR